LPPSVHPKAAHGSPAVQPPAGRSHADGDEVAPLDDAGPADRPRPSPRRGSRFPRALVPPNIRVNGFICGCGHCGTTLIATILSVHPDAYVPLWETNIFIDDSWRSRRRHLKLLWKAALQRRRAFIEKTPLHVHHVDEIRSAVPGARFVMPVRDGRDNVAAMVRRHGNLQHAMDRWIDDNSIVLAERRKPDVLVYRHEDLVADPPGVVRRICEFLELDYRGELLEFHRRQRLWWGHKAVGRQTGREGGQAPCAARPAQLAGQPAHLRQQRSLALRTDANRSRRNHPRGGPAADGGVRLL
jgi:hypothetical protein